MGDGAYFRTIKPYESTLNLKGLALHETSNPDASHEAQTTTGIDHRKILIWSFLGSECLFFGSLISTYLIYFGKSLVGQYPVDVFDILVTSTSTFVLLMSSLMMVLAYNSISHGDLLRFRVWILCTAALGATFLGFQVFEFYDFAEHGLTPRTNLFGSSFFTLTGFHGAHVTVGVIWLLSLFG